MTASAAEVEAAQKAMGCSRQKFVTRKGSAEVVCRMHQEYAPDFKSILAGEWTDRGCPVAVAVADAVVAAAQPRIAAETLRREATRFDHMGGMLTSVGVALRLDERADEIEAQSWTAPSPDDLPGLVEAVGKGVTPLPSLPDGMRPIWADEVPDMPQPCAYLHHGPYAHKHVGYGRAWFYKPAPEANP